MTSDVIIRPARPEDAETAGRICYQGFYTINTSHSFAPEMPQVEMGIGLLTMLFSHPGCYCVVAEADGRVIGSNCLDENEPAGAWLPSILF
jgi:hypothetical protein